MRNIVYFVLYFFGNIIKYYLVGKKKTKNDFMFPSSIKNIMQTLESINGAYSMCYRTDNNLSKVTYYIIMTRNQLIIIILVQV